MNRRTQLLLVVFAVIILGVIYGDQLRKMAGPVLNLSEEIDSRRAQLESLESTEKRYVNALHEYKRLVERVGGVSPTRVRDELLLKLRDLQFRHRLTSKVLTPIAPTLDRKTGNHTVSFSLAGQGSFEQVMAFLRDVYELPHLIQVVDPKLEPVMPGRDKPQEDLVKLNVRLDALVLNPNAIPSTEDRTRLRLAVPKNARNWQPDWLHQPENYVRYAAIEWGPVLERKPFMEWVQPVKPPVIVEGPKGPIVPPPPKDISWTGQWRLFQTYRVDVPVPRQKAMVENIQARGMTKTVATGNDFDGGELLYAGTKGALVRRPDGDFIYPLGELFQKRIKIRGEETFREGFTELRAAYEGLPPREEGEKDKEKG